MAASLTDALIVMNSGDTMRMREGQARFDAMKAADFSGYMMALCRELVVGSNTVARQVAGAMLKGELYSKEETKQGELGDRWRSLDPTIRQQIKEGLLQTLGTDDIRAGHSAAMLISKIAAFEVPAQEWGDLMDRLLPNMQVDSEHLRQATVHALGYICEAVPVAAVTPEAIAATLTAIMAGLAAEEPSENVRLAAAKAMSHALPYLDGAMTVPEERDYVMTVLCSATQAADTRTRRSALEALIKIISSHYAQMAPYMESLFSLAFTAVRADEEPSALQAIEVIATVCEEEMYIAAMTADAAAHRQPPEVFSAFYIRNWLQYITPLLLETMCRQKPGQEEGAWTLSMAAGTCLDIVARTVGNLVLPACIEFISGNIESADWHLREAAIFAFGSILSGVTTDAVETLVYTGIPRFAALMSDSVVLVGESASWTLGRICKMHHLAIAQEHFVALLHALNTGLELNWRVASNCAWAIGNLATAQKTTSASPTSPLSAFYNDLFRSLLAVAIRPDESGTTNLRNCCYAAISSLVRVAAADCLDSVFSVFEVVVVRLQETLAYEVASEADVERRADMQSVLCSVLRDITQKVAEGMAPFTDSLMELYMGVFRCRETSVHEEALLCVGALANAVDMAIAPTLNEFYPVLLFGLKNFAEHNVCKIALGVVGDISRALDDEFMAYVPETMAVLFEDLQSPDLPPSVKAAILSLFGDIAMAVDAQFVEYFEPCMQVLLEAALVTVDATVPEHVEYLNDLRENTCEGFTGIIQGMRESLSNMLPPYAAYLYDFCNMVYADTTRSEEVTRGICSIVFDLSIALLASHRETVAQYLGTDWVRALVTEMDSSDDPETMEVAKFARKSMKKFGF